VENNVAKYLTQQVMTASPEKLVYMLYDKAIASLREAIAAIEAGDIEGRWRANKRAMDIVEHMWSTLDVEQGGEIGENLNKLLPFMMLRLPDVDIKNDPAPAEEVIRVMEPLRDAWREIAMNGAPGAAPRPAAEGAPAQPANTAERTIISA
jgi:flagellar protein FliS